MFDLDTGVYVWANTINGKVYVGSAAVSFDRRRWDHQHKLRQNKHFNRHLQAAWNRDGEVAFEFQVIETCEPSQCLAREQVCIDLFNATDPECGYNMQPTAGSPLGRPLTQATKDKISQANTGQTRSDESKTKMSASHKAMTIPPEQRAKMVASRVGLVPTQEHRDNISKAKRGKTFTDEHRAKLSAVARNRKPRVA